MATKPSAEASRQLLAAAERMLRAKRARESLMEFTKLTMPDPDDPDHLSRYQPAKHHELIAGELEKLEKGHVLRQIITVPPRFGKSELSSRRFPAWFMGRDPYRQLILATYNEEFAVDFGRNVRNIMQSTAYQQVFPEVELKKGSAAADRLETVAGGLAVFVGRGGSLTGRGADLLIIDDPIKDREEADSPTVRNKLWSWFTDVAMTRLVSFSARVIVIQTRWHEDDLVGRLTDPKNPCYNAEEAAKWKVVDLPALARPGDPLGRPEGESLWPERFDLAFLHAARRLNPKGFSALYQQRPTPDDGDYFKADWLTTYQPEELPKNLRMYCTSDHAVSKAQDRDSTVLLPFGVDEDDTIWILPELYWKQAATDEVVEAMLDMMQIHQPLMWGAERGHISASIGPFLRKRMTEENVHCYIEELTPVKDKQTRAQAIRGRMAMKKVRFPGFAPWWSDAREQLLKFPSARHDDFVDALAWAGKCLPRHISANPERPKEIIKPGTWAWLKRAANFQRRQVDLKKTGGF